MKLGISSYTYTWAVGVPAYPCEGKKLSALDLVNKASKVGVQVVQICDNLHLHKLGKEELTELRQTAEKLGITIEVGTCGVEPEHLRMYLEIAHLLNSDIVRVLLHKSNGLISINEAYEYINEVLHEFESKKIKIVIENHERHSVKELTWLVDKLNSEYVGICLDTVNSFAALECPQQVIKIGRAHV